MPKVFYTERDVEDLVRRGVTSLVISDDVVVTDLGREKAMKLGLELIRKNDQPSSAPIRPYIAQPVAPKPAVTPPKTGTTLPERNDLEQKVLKAVQAKVGDAVAPELLEVIIKRVIQNIGGK